MTKKKTTIVSVVLFAVIFAALLITATFTDFQVSSILTAKPLASHEYITNSAFGAMFEAFGSVPVYLVTAFAAEILFWYAIRKNKDSKTGIYLLSLLPLALTLVMNYVLTNDVMNYVLKHLFMTDDASPYSGAAYLIGVEVFMALLLAFFEIMAVNNFSDESIEKLVRFAIAVLVTAAVAQIIIELLKSPVGRIRYRAMNLDPDNEIHGFSAFARWYEINGDKWKALYPDRASRLAEFGSTDTFKSFPSGHTCAAGATYSLIMLNKALDIKKKSVRVLLWVCPILFTGTVAVSRIAVGAHFFSDVLVGGTIAFVCMIAAREIFLFRGEHFKALFGKKEG